MKRRGGPRCGNISNFYRFSRGKQGFIIDLVVIVITGFGSIDTAVDSMKHGAFDYLEKPFKVEELKLCLWYTGSRTLPELKQKVKTSGVLCG